MNKKFLFVDTETTGLVAAGGAILEIALIVTDSKLNELEVYNTAIYHDKYTLDGMSHWAEQSHTASGLIEECKASKVTTAQVEAQILDILERHFSGVEKPILSGSSVHFDKNFIAYHMPNLNKRLHYRIIDVSSFMEAVKIYTGVEPERSHVAHRALADIRDSIRYLKSYLERLA